MSDCMTGETMYRTDTEVPKILKALWRETRPGILSY